MSRSTFKFPTWQGQTFPKFNNYGDPYAITTELFYLCQFGYKGELVKFLKGFAKFMAKHQDWLSLEPEETATFDGFIKLAEDCPNKVVGQLMPIGETVVRWVEDTLVGP
jgi:hypothetical protein